MMPTPNWFELEDTLHLARMKLMAAYARLSVVREDYMMSVDRGGDESDVGEWLNAEEEVEERERDLATAIDAVNVGAKA